MLEESRRRIKSIGPGRVMDWRFHGEASPTQCLSIRTMDLSAFTGTTYKKLIMAQVLVKLDTLQVRRIRAV